MDSGSQAPSESSHPQVLLPPNCAGSCIHRDLTLPFDLQNASKSTPPRTFRWRSALHPLVLAQSTRSARAAVESAAVPVLMILSSVRISTRAHLGAPIACLPTTGASAAARPWDASIARPPLASPAEGDPRLVSGRGGTARVAPGGRSRRRAGGGGAGRGGFTGDERGDGG